MTRLRQNPPAVYQLGPGDILGVYIETVIGDSDEPLPVHFHQDGSLPPAVGYPVPVREDGTIDVPYVAPIHVTGMTLTQTTESIRRAYTDDRSILPKGKDRIIVSLMRRRTYQVLVVREESGAQEGVSKRGTGHVVELAAYENDLLHALNATGGMPGLDAVNEVLVFHGLSADGARRDHLLAAIQTGRGAYPDDPTVLDCPDLVRIPLRFYPEEVPGFTQEDIVLWTGDIVLIKARDREKFYTGGAIPGGEHLLPRDYDLDVLEAIALAGGSVGNSGIGLASNNGSAFGGNRGNVGLAPSRAIVVRKLDCGGQVPIQINLNKALPDPSERILIQPEDLIIVRYTLFEELYNTVLNLFQFNILLNGAVR
ncbi:MAG: polysaccharide biosynthesis/export family protein [Planctomycetes bacterium]|nr:polysaccharide biosynthesis/export family protein [Planctomycetota bacterium]